MDETREITKEQYRQIFDAAHDLFGLIHARMADVKRDEAYQTPEWSELHDLLQLASVISQTALRYSNQAAAAPAPVTVTMIIDAAPLLAEGLYRDRG